VLVSNPHPIGSPLAVQVYSGEVDTVGSVLAALNVTDWAWPPYASNIVLELWRRTATESQPRVGAACTDELGKTTKSGDDGDVGDAKTWPFHLGSVEFSACTPWDQQR